MIQYRCVFTFSRSSITLRIVAPDPALAVEKARETVPHYDAVSVELFDAAGSVMRVDRKARSVAEGKPGEFAFFGDPFAE